MLSIIVAKSKNNVIGKDNHLLWHLEDDLKRFKDLTLGHTIIMGRKTFESLGRVLPNRKHVVLTTNHNYKVEDENVKIVYSIDDLMEYINSNEENFVIGGEKIYKLLMPYTTKMYVTEINKDFDGDAYFLEIDESKWKVVNTKHVVDKKSGIKYLFIDYIKI